MAVIGVRQESCREQRQIGGRSWRREGNTAKLIFPVPEEDIYTQEK